MIVDANAHISESGCWFQTDKAATIESLLESMQKAKIDKSVLLPLPGVINNEVVRSIEEKYPDQIIGGGVFNPALYNGPFCAVSAYYQEIIETKTKIVKFHNRLSGFGMEDERFLEVLKYNNNTKNPIPVAICGFFHGQTVSKSVVPPSYIFDLAQIITKTSLIILHGSGTWLLKTAEMVRSLKNVHLDLSFTVSQYKGTSIDSDIKWLCNNFDRRIIWGSDTPEFSQAIALKDFLDAVGNLNSNKLDNILGNNILSILSL
jgi:predicted TIM-barrel fold metal-dependent hydrolase